MGEAVGIEAIEAGGAAVAVFQEGGDFEGAVLRKFEDAAGGVGEARVEEVGVKAQDVEMGMVLVSLGVFDRDVAVFWVIEKTGAGLESSIWQ